MSGLSVAYRRYVETVNRPADPEGRPGTPQPQLSLPTRDLSIPERRGSQKHRWLYRCQEWSAVAKPGDPEPDCLAGVVWEEFPSQRNAGAKAGRGLRVIATLDRPLEHIVQGGAHHLLHVSLSYPEHLPAWWEVTAVKDAIFGPMVDAMMVLPRASDYVNIHQFVLQLWQMPLAWGIR
jgi:hypothetical protein